MHNATCVSGYCDNRNRICRGSNTHKAYVGQFCEFNYECKSENCNRQYKKCLGGGDDPAMYLEVCTRNIQCMSGYCDTNQYSQTYLRCL